MVGDMLVERPEEAAVEAARGSEGGSGGLFAGQNAVHFVVQFAGQNAVPVRTAQLVHTAESVHTAVPVRTVRLAHTELAVHTAMAVHTELVVYTEVLLFAGFEGTAATLGGNTWTGSCGWLHRP